MSISKTPSSLIEGQFPDWVHDDGPNLIAFVKAYYEWTEQSNNTIEVTRNLSNYQDVDTAYSKYLEYLEREIIPNFPKEALVDRVLFFKHARQLYNARGSENAIKLLFRIIFNEDISLRYPSELMLRASDGRWEIETSLQVTETTGSIEGLLGQNITGNTSGATGNVDKVIKNIIEGVTIYEIYLINISGVFQNNETVQNEDTTTQGVVFFQSGPLKSIEIGERKGALHVMGDLASVTSSSGTGGVARVTALTNLSAADWVITYGGNGYIVDSKITVTGGSGFESNFIVTGIIEQESLEIDIDLIGSIADVVLETGLLFISLGANTTDVSANLASANINSVIVSSLLFSNTTVGAISNLQILNYGYGYTTLPTSSVVYGPVQALYLIDDVSGQFKGENADITAVRAPGSIDEVSIFNPGSGYKKNLSVTLTNTTREGTDSAEGTPEVGGFITYPGKYRNRKGWLSSDSRLQDNLYYQEYSYDIKTINKFKRYNNHVLTLSHPAGMALFGTNIINISANTTPHVNTEVLLSTGAFISQDADLLNVSQFGTHQLTPGTANLSPQPFLDQTVNTSTVHTDVFGLHYVRMVGV